MNIGKFLPPVPGFVRRALRGLGRLHLGLYFLFGLMVFFGGTTASFFEKYSLIDVDLLKTEWTRAAGARERGEKFELSQKELMRIFRPIKVEKKKRQRYVKGEWKETEVYENRGAGAGLYFLFILVWLWPLYRHYFGGKRPPQSAAEKRIVNLPLVLFVLSWAVSLQRYFMSAASYAESYGPAPDRMKLVFAVSSLLMGAFVSYLNLEITGAYIRRYIARPFFRETDPYGLKHGFAFDLTLRYALMLFSLAAVPLALCVYIPAYANFDIFLDLVRTARASGEGPVFGYDTIRALAPLFVMGVLVVLMLLFQFVSLLFYRWNVQVPISALVRRMKAVAAGDFGCKTSVFYADELGQLKGHFNLMLDGLVEREHIKDTFGRYVSIEIAEKIMKSGRVNLAGEEIQATVLFSDICGFTPLSEKLPPAELIRFLNDYFSHITAPIMTNRGVINKFIGDAVMAIFSPVFGVEDHRAAGVRAALGMREALARFNAGGKYPTVEFGVGLHSGGLVAGNVGTESRLEYTVLGDTVNVASRIESQTRTAGAQILLSEAVMAGVRPEDFPGVVFTKGRPVLMKGKSEPMSLYTIG
ncbi:MAG TPA: adenylate/guanylate cyclase domain-containing protein [Elusimicrobiales bacterium]|nr:adenylate/guanylate cyclase domain-containing protein [Elusimicrobiales bacterium]